MVKMQFVVSWIVNFYFYLQVFWEKKYACGTAQAGRID
jgi:hypothetical protein